MPSWNRKVHHRVQRARHRPYPDIDDSSPYLHVLFHKVHFTNIFPCTPSFFMLFPDQNCICISEMRHSYLISKIQALFIDFPTFSWTRASRASLATVKFKIYGFVSPPQFIFQVIFNQIQKLCLYTLTSLMNIRMFLASNMKMNLSWLHLFPLSFPFSKCYLIRNFQESEKLIEL